MSKVIVMPKLGYTQDEGQIAEWHKKVGEHIYHCVTGKHFQFNSFVAFEQTAFTELSALCYSYATPNSL